MEKKEIKISLGTFICLLIIAVLLVAVIGMYMKGNNNNDTNQLLQNNIQNDGTIGESTGTDANSDFVKKFSEKMQKIKNTINREYYHYDVDEIALAENNSNLKYGNDVKILAVNNGEYSYGYVDEGNNAVEYIYNEYNEEIDGYKGHIYIETTDDMKNAYIALAFEVDDNTKLKAKSYIPYKINGVTGKIKKVFIAEEGQDTNGIFAKTFILLEDGTLKYVDCIDGIKTGEFNAYNCEGINNKIGKIKDVRKVNGSERVNGEFDGGWIDWILENEKGEYFKWNVE